MYKLLQIYLQNKKFTLNECEGTFTLHYEHEHGYSMECNFLCLS